MPRRYGQDLDTGARGPSRSELKRASQALQELGEALCALPPAALVGTDIDERLREAIEDYRRTKTFEARRRQLQYVGKLLRDTEVTPLRAAVRKHGQGRAADARRHRTVELWRERLLADDAALGEWTALHPQSDTPQFRSLLRQARRETQTAADATGRRACRELFRQLRDAEQA